MAENGEVSAAAAPHERIPEHGPHSSEDEDEEDTEPRLKYTKLTTHLSQVFKGKDSASACIASGDKFLVGTHSGSIYVYSLPSLELLRSYKAHSASITALSVSSYAPSVSPATLNDALNVQFEASDRPSTLARAPTVSSLRSNAASLPKRPRPTQSTASRPSPNIYIGSASIDGHVCVSSLADPKDVTLRNFARPVQAVALSPDCKTSPSYLSGGLAGHLILTTGGKQGASENAHTIDAAAAASGWLGQIGLGSATGHDTILHQGEGSISAIRWSLSRKFVAWVNETGVKIMRSNVELGTEDLELAWRRIGHVDKPNSRAWDDKGALWKAKVQWVDAKSLEPSDNNAEKNGFPRLEKKTEELLVGWGDTVWLLHVYGEGSAARSGSAKGFKTPVIVHQFKFDDGVISGLSLYTPNLLLALIYRTRDDDDRPIATPQDSTPRRGIPKRQNGMPPELRLVDITSDQIEELDIESLKFDRYQTLSFADYHMSTLFFEEKAQLIKDPRNSLSALGDGLWDVSRNATRLFSSGASVMSGFSDPQSDRRTASTSQASTAVSAVPATMSFSRGLPPAFTNPGLKIFILSPFESLLATKRDGSDHLKWLTNQKQYEEAWNYIDQHPDVVSPQHVSPLPQSRPDTPSKARETLAEFLDDDSSSTSSAATLRAKSKLPAVAREKRIIGDLWVGQLVQHGNWELAGTTARKVLDLAERWEYWISVFAEAGKFDEISSSMPSQRLKPQISPYCYERVLQHYIEVDRMRLQVLMDNWSTDLFDVDRVTNVISIKLDSEDFSIQKDASNDNTPGRDWSILENSLAQLYLATNRPADALHCYLQTRNADRAIDICRDNQLFSSIAESVFEFATIAVSQQQESSASLDDLDDMSKEPIRLLASATSQNILSASSAISQFQAHSPQADPYLFFYCRALWDSDVNAMPSSEPDKKSSTHARRARFAPAVPTNFTRQFLAPHGDLVVTLFATYSPSLLNSLLRARDATDDPAAGGSIPYTFEHASAICESHGLMEELVYLLAATGQSQKALHRICEGAGRRRRHREREGQDDNVTWAIQFCRETDDQSLWDDLLSFSLKRPPFLRGLLNDTSIGASGSDHERQSGIDPIKLVRSIADGMEIPGLKPALERLVKDADVQKSIAAGAAQVLHSEIMSVMEEVVDRRKRGIAFDFAQPSSTLPAATLSASETDKSDLTPPAQKSLTLRPKSPCCLICNESHQSPDPEAPQDRLIAYSCSHVYHLTCLLDACTSSTSRRLVDELQRKLAASTSDGSGDDPHLPRGRVGGKIARMQMVGRVLAGRGCLRCEQDRDKTKNGGG